MSTTVSKVLTKIFGSRNDRLLKRYRAVVAQINAFETASGLKVGVERIEGSIFGDLTLHGVTLSDPQGVFFRAPTAELDYRPLAYIRNHIDIEALNIPTARLSRLPGLRPGDPNAPLLPDIDIFVMLNMGRLEIKKRDPALFPCQCGRLGNLSSSATVGSISIVSTGARTVRGLFPGT